MPELNLPNIDLSNGFLNEEDEYAWYTIFNYVITFDGEEIYSTTERNVYPK